MEYLYIHTKELRMVMLDGEDMDIKCEVKLGEKRIWKACIQDLHLRKLVWNLSQLPKSSSVKGPKRNFDVLRLKMHPSVFT